MWCITGLGNPGPRYLLTRHNVGFMAVDLIADRYGARFAERPDYHYAELGSGAGRILLVKPMTFMNRSGLALMDVLKRYPVEPEQVVLVYDDMDIEPGRIKLKSGGSAGGHNGLKSILALTQLGGCPRVKIGIGRGPGMEASEYVLGRFRPDERALIGDAVEEAADAAIDVTERGILAAMNKYNRKPQAAGNDAEA